MLDTSSTEAKHMPTARRAAKQRADYTHRHNVGLGRHGWLRLTPAYSVKLVRETMRAPSAGTRVLDPFSGTGTTPLCAAYLGLPAVAVEINPFLVWLGQAKTATYSPGTLSRALESARAIALGASREKPPKAAPPPIHNIERWWNPRALDFLCLLKGGIEHEHTRPSKVRDLLLIGFCRTMIRLSNAAFNHQSMSFNDRGPSCRHRQTLLFDEKGLAEVFLQDLAHVVEAAADNPEEGAEITEGDSREISHHVSGAFRLLITSPPYPNRMSYIRELRPYMYWLGYLTSAPEASELDWRAIGGTWGVATSRLKDWEPSGEAFLPRGLQTVLRNIASEGTKSGELLSNYVAKYFEDIWTHLQNVRTVIASGGRVHYIVGNSSFYGVLVPTERLYCEMLAQLGFREVKARLIRKRNSKKELFEFDVSAVRS